MEQNKRTQIAELGEFGLIDKLTGAFAPRNRTTLRGVGDDAAVIAASRSEATLVSTDLLMEGIDFDLTYFPLKHLGYKTVTVGASDILAMNALPEQLLLSLGVSSKFSVEALQEFYEGVRLACEELNIDLAGGDTTASVTGLTVNVTAIGRARRSDIVYRNGAKPNDLICITGNLGAAYMGLQLLEREKRVLHDVENPEPQFAGHEYLLEKYLKPRARRDVIAALAEEKLRPTAMIDLSDGLASDLMQLCKASDCGARIYLERIPIARQTHQLAEEMHTDPVVAALNGGQDHELLFTVPNTCFIPAPKVTSAVIRCRTRKTPPVAVRSETMLWRTVRAGFALRRKTLVNSLQTAFPLPKAQLTEIVERCGLEPTVRGERLGLADYARLADALGEAVSEN